MELSHNEPSAKARVALIPFLTIGTAAIIFGGLFSAATARAANYHSAWFVAYLVLVVGVAQVALGLGQWWLASKPLSVALLVGELVIFNLGNAGVILGTVLASPLWVNLGSALLVLVLAGFAWAVLSPRRRGGALWAYWVLVVLLLASVGVGLFFANVGAP